MKKLFLITIVAIHFLSGCRGLEHNPAVQTSSKKVTSFEEKQKQSLPQNTLPNVVPPNSPFNFRFAAQKATPGVVHIKSLYLNNIPEQTPDLFKDFFGDEFWRRYFSPEPNTPQIQVGSASGVIVSTDGYIVTNNHVVENADSIEVVLHDQRDFRAKVIGTDPSTDLALLKIDATNLSFIEFGNSDSVEVGDVVLAVGNPFNLASTVTAGIVSAKARNINILTDKSAVESYIQTDAAVNRGNSGGALVDINGKLIGINAAIATPTGVYAGYSFAIPVEIVKKIIDDLLKYGKAERGFLGVVISDMNGEKAKMIGARITTGILVDSLLPNGGAVRAGININDIIIKVDDHNVETATQLREMVARHRPGEKLQLTVIRNNQEKTIPVTLLPEEKTAVLGKSAHAVVDFLGIEIANLTAAEKDKWQVRGGVKITTIKNGIIASRTEMKEGFVVTSINNIVVNNTDDFINRLRNKKGGVMLEGFYPGVPGKYYYAFGL